MIAGRDAKADGITIGVLALQGDVREHVRALGECGQDAKTGGETFTVTARAVRRPEELDSVDALVIPGGESTTMSKLAVDFGLLDPIRKRIGDGMPAYGSCAGMIMLASEVLDGRPDQQSFGGIEMTVRRNAFGRQVDSFESSVELAGVPGPAFHAVFIRAPWVERVGPDVEVLGRVDRPGQTGRIVAVRQRNLLATAFHPELTPDLRVHRYFVEMAREQLAI